MKGGLRRLVAVGALSCAAVLTIAQSHHGFRGLQADFITRYAAGELTARGSSPYDDDELFVESRALAPRLAAYPMYDAPPVAAVFRLVASLPLLVAARLVLLLSLAACVVLAWSLTRGSPSTLAVATVAVLVFSPARHTLHLGQIDLLVLALVLLLARWQPVLAIAKPQTTAITSLALFAEGRRRGAFRALAVAGAGALALLAVTAVLASSATWGDWLDHLGTREEGGPRPVLIVVTLVGVAMIVRAIRRPNTDRPLDLVCAAGAATGLFAAMGGWNPQWFLAQALPLGTLLLAARSGQVVLRRHHAVLLVLVCGLAAGDAYITYSFDLGLFIPVLIVFGLLVGLVALREVPARAAVAILAVNAAVTAVPLGRHDRIAVPMVVGVILLHLVLELRPQRVEARPVGSRSAAGAPAATVVASSSGGPPTM